MHRKIIVKKYNIKAPVDDSLKIVFFADLHIKQKSIYKYEQIIDTVSWLKPDYILIGGDLICTYDAAYNGVRNNYGWLERLSCFLKKLTEICKVYYVNGNHEENLRTAINFAYDDVYQKYIESLSSANVYILNNKKIRLRKNIDLYGFVQPYECYRKIDYENLSLSSVVEMIGDSESSKYNILLTHDPKFFDQCHQWGANLVLSGHVHGGFLHIGNCGLISPEYKLFPKYCYGQYNIGNSNMIITSGVNAGRPWFRIFNKPEIVLVSINN